MAKILNSYSITEQLNKVVETFEGFILNGVYYDKQTFTPQPLDLFPTIGNSNLLAINRRISFHANNYMCFNNHADSVVKDSYEPNITYVFTECGVNNPQLRILKLEESNGTCNIINQFDSSLFVTGLKFKEYLGQNQNFLYAIFRNNVSSYCVSINKITLAMVNIQTLSSNYSCVNRKIVETPQFVYIYSQDYISNNKAWILDKTINKISAVTTVTNGGSAYRQCTPSDGLNIEENKYMIFTVNEMSSVLNIKRRILDISISDLTKCITEDNICTINWNNIPISDQPSLLPATGQNNYCLEIIQKNDKNYLTLITCDTTGANLASINSYAIYNFEILEDYSLLFKGCTRPSGSLLKGYVMNKTKDTILTICTNTIRVYKFNNLTELWEEKNLINVNATSAGFDLSENIWYENINQEVEMISDNSASEVIIRFENENYKFVGEDINTNILIGIKNLNDEFIKAKLKLSIKGEALFTSNSTKFITVETNNMDFTILPITIKNGGQILIYPELII